MIIAFKIHDVISLKTIQKQVRENIIEHTFFLNACSNLSTIFLFLILKDFILFLL